MRRLAILVLWHYSSLMRFIFLRVLSCSLILNGFAVGLGGLRAWVAPGLGGGGWLESGAWVALWVLGLWGSIGVIV